MITRFPSICDLLVGWLGVRWKRFSLLWCRKGARRGKCVFMSYHQYTRESFQKEMKDWKRIVSFYQRHSIRRGRERGEMWNMITSNIWVNFSFASYHSRLFVSLRSVRRFLSFFSSLNVSMKLFPRHKMKFFSFVRRMKSKFFGESLKDVRNWVLMNMKTRFLKLSSTVVNREERRR